MSKKVRTSFWPSLMSLLLSTSTLLCCALPALLVTLGLGATLAGIISTVPWITALSKYKDWIFTATGIVLITSGFIIYSARKSPCPVDKKKARACQLTRRISAGLYVLSVMLYCTGLFFAYFATVFQ